ncbi:MAG: ATP-grasp domain-containing protein, partial [Phycisphaerae bacterium]|nr:ATP-grasp domain-containing protein [Phycisphaerae bacterium]
AELEENGVKILGTSPKVIEMAEDRHLFRAMMDRLGIPMPAADSAATLEEALAAAARIGYPLMLRPSFVLGGRGMEVIYDEDMLRQYIEAAVDVTPERPILIDKFLQDAREVEADAISDGTDVFIPAIMEHIELAGIHSGDSACVIPPISVSEKHLATISEYTRRIASEMGVVGLMNMQYAICDDVVYVLEANPRASRTVPLVSKVCGIAMARIATQVMLGKKIAELGLTHPTLRHFGAKEAVFPFPMLPEVDPILGPEMRSTGEVLGMAENFGLAFFKAQEAAKSPLPTEGTVLISVSRRDRELHYLSDVAKKFSELGFTIKATRGTGAYLAEQGIACETICKLYEGRPNITDGVTNGEIQLIINTPAGKASQYDDSYIRKAAVKYGVPYITTLPAALAAAEGIRARRNGDGEIRSLQEFHEQLK